MNFEFECNAKQLNSSKIYSSLETRPKIFLESFLDNRPVKLTSEGGIVKGKYRIKREPLYHQSLTKVPRTMFNGRKITENVETLQPPKINLSVTKALVISEKQKLYEFEKIKNAPVKGNARTILPYYVLAFANDIRSQNANWSDPASNQNLHHLVDQTANYSAKYFNTTIPNFGKELDPPTSFFIDKMLKFGKNESVILKKNLLNNASKELCGQIKESVNHIVFCLALLIVVVCILLVIYAICSLPCGPTSEYHCPSETDDINYF